MSLDAIQESRNTAGDTIGSELCDTDAEKLHGAGPGVPMPASIYGIPCTSSRIALGSTTSPFTVDPVAFVPGPSSDGHLI